MLRLMHPEERFKFDFLATLYFDSTIQPLSMWLTGAPDWAEQFITRLLDDGLAALCTGTVHDAEHVSADDARKLLASRAARTNDDVWLAVTDHGSRLFSESEPRALFDYCASSADLG
jgi:hypothetical protein